MTNDFEKVFDTAAEPQDYTGEDGLLYCGSCRTPKEAYFPADKAALFGRDRHPAECDCQRAKRLEREAAEQRRKHLDTVEELKRRGFTDSKMREWTFANDNGKCPQMGMAHSYVERWEQMIEGNKPLIVTTNHTPDMLENPQDTAHARIYDRLIEMCSPVCFTAKNFRKEAAKAKLDRLKELLK